MFKKTLIAAAMATTASFAAVASDVSVTATTIGVEYAAGNPSLDAATVTVDLGRDYAAGDIITLTVSGATFIESTGSPAAAVTPTITGTGDAAGKVEFLQYKDSNSVRVLVTAEIDSSTAAGITVAGTKLDLTGAANEGTVKFVSAGRVDTVDGPIDVDSSTATTYVTFATELATKVGTAFDAVVDVNASRELFVGGGSTDTLIIENTRATVGTGVSTVSATYTLYGDFSFLDKNEDGDLGDTGDGSITASEGTVTYAADLQSATVKSTATFATGTVGITVNAPTGVTIKDQSFSTKASVEYSNPAGGATNLNTETLAMTSAGAWTLNGAQAHIPFLPYGPDFAQSITVSNTSSQVGAAELIVYFNGTAMNMGEIGTVTAKGVTNLSGAVRNAMNAAGITGAVSMDIIVNAPSDSIVVEAIYYSRSDGDRLRTL